MENNDSRPLNREDEVFSELKQIRKILSAIIGTSDLNEKEKFSQEAITKAAKEFQKMQIERGEWVGGYDIRKVIKHSTYNSPKLLIDQFQFKNYFKRGNKYYFNKSDLVELNKELIKRNIHLEKYEELLQDKEKFQKYIQSISAKKLDKTIKRYKIPKELENVYSVPYSLPIEQQIRDEIKTLLGEYKKFDLSTYVDLYERKTYSMFKYQYEFDRYLKPELKKLCKDWCFKFNYANNALMRILELKKGSLQKDHI